MNGENDLRLEQKEKSQQSNASSNSLSSTLAKPDDCDPAEKLLETGVDADTTVVSAFDAKSPPAAALDEEEETPEEASEDAVDATPSGDTNGGMEESAPLRAAEGGVFPAPQSMTNESFSSSSSSSSSSRMLFPVMGISGVVDLSLMEEALAGEAGGLDSFSCRLISLTGPPLMLKRSCSISGDAISSISSNTAVDALANAADPPSLPGRDPAPELPSFSFVEIKLRNELSNESFFPSSSAPVLDVTLADADAAPPLRISSAGGFASVEVRLLNSFDRSDDVFRIPFNTFSSGGLM